MQNPVFVLGELNTIIIVATNFIVRIIKTIYNTLGFFGIWLSSGISICLHSCSKLKLFLKCFLAKTFIKEPDILNCYNNDTRDSLNEVKVFKNRTHSLSLFLYITNEDKCKMDVVIIYRYYYINPSNPGAGVTNSIFNDSKQHDSTSIVSKCFGKPPLRRHSHVSDRL